MQLALALLFGALVGAALGGLGAGGSILVLPAMIYGLSIDPKTAVVCSLAVVGATSLFAAAIHWRAGHVRPGVAAMFAVTGAVGAYGGALLTRVVTEVVILVSLAVVMLVVGGLMLRSGRRDEPGASDRPPPARRIAWVLGAGLAVGVLTGFLGVGGGFLIVPALTLVARLPVKHAIGTSLLVIAINCASGIAAHRARGLDLELVGLFLLGSLGASYVASHLMRARSSGTLKRAFAVFILLIGGLILADNLIRSG